MKNLRLAIASVVILTASVHAGKNVIEPLSDPIPVPVVNIPLGLYLGGGLTYTSSKCQCSTDVKFSDGSTSRVSSAKTYGYNLKAGYFINKFLAVEAKYIYTPWGDKNSKLKHYGAYLKPVFAVSENLDLYALLGYGVTDCNRLNASQKGFAWGAGAEYTVNKKVDGQRDGVGLYVEYLRPLKKTGNKNITVDMVNAGVSYHF